MKRASSILLAAMLLLVAATCSLGAVHNIRGDFFSVGYISGEVDIYVPKSIDTWFYVTPDPKQLKIIAGSWENWGDGVSAEYFINDQTFISLATINSDIIDNPTLIKGSYLFSFGLFVGLEFASDDTYDYTLISPGYRFSFGDDSYLALSVDYRSDSDDFSDIVGYEMSGKYLTDNMKFYGQIWVPKESGSESTYELGLNFLVADTLVIGLGYYHTVDNTITGVGFTWTLERFILDFVYGTEDDAGTEYTSYEVGGMFLINDAFGIGLDYLNIEDVDDAQISFKLKYTNGDNQFALIIRPENDSFRQQYYLTYNMKY